jgi:hypothetical protein
MFRFLHAADIHLDSPLRGLHRYSVAPQDEIRQASRRALANSVQLTVDESTAFVLIAGKLGNLGITSQGKSISQRPVLTTSPRFARQPLTAC